VTQRILQALLEAGAIPVNLNTEVMPEPGNGEDEEFYYGICLTDNKTNHGIQYAAAGFLRQVLAASNPDAKKLHLLCCVTSDFMANMFSARQAPSTLLTNEQLEELGTTIRNSFPNLTSFGMWTNALVPDNQRCSMLQCVPNNLTTLKIACKIEPTAGGDINMLDTFCQITHFQSLTKLEVLFANWARRVPTSQTIALSLESFQALADALGVVDEDSQERFLPNLHKVTIQGLLCRLDIATACWAPVLRAIGNIPNLKEVNVCDLRHITRGQRDPSHPFFDDGARESLQFGHRVQQITKQYRLSQTKVVLDGWLGAMVAVRDRFNLYHSFFSKVFPSSMVYDPQARRRQMFDETLKSCFSRLEGRSDNIAARVTKQENQKVVGLEAELARVKSGVIFWKREYCMLSVFAFFLMALVTWFFFLPAS